MRYSASRFERSYSTILSPAPAATARAGLKIELEPEPDQGARVGQPEDAQGEVPGQGSAPPEIALQLDRSTREHRRPAQHPEQLAAARGPARGARIHQSRAPAARR